MTFIILFKNKIYFQYPIIQQEIRYIVSLIYRVFIYIKKTYIPFRIINKPEELPGKKPGSITYLSHIYNRIFFIMIVINHILLI